MSFIPKSTTYVVSGYEVNYDVRKYKHVIIFPLDAFSHTYYELNQAIQFFKDRGIADFIVQFGTNTSQRNIARQDWYIVATCNDDVAAVEYKLTFGA